MQMGRCCHCDPPTILPGKIYRFVYPSFPADYAGIATASWSSGTTGNPDENFNCRYVTLTTPDQKATSTQLITDPVRYSVYGPSTDGGIFDYWVASGITRATKLRYYHELPFELGFHPVTDGMIPSGSHAEWVDGELSLDFSVLPVPAIAGLTEPNLYLANQIQTTVRVHAFAHRINGSIVGAVKVYPFSAADSICAIASGDVYEVDVWYKVDFTASSALPSTSGSVSRWLHTTRVSNGSRRLTKGARPRYTLIFSNANFSPNFDVLRYSYEISIAGQTGWNLIYGANGPVPVQSYDNVWIGLVSGSAASMLSVSSSHPVKSIVLAWNREVAVVVVTRASLGVFEPSQQYLYRSTTASAEYRTETVSTDIGSVDHAQYGFFNQSGTTVFEYVPWNTGFVYGSVFRGIHDGVDSNAAIPTKPAELPQTITFTRIPRPTTGSTTYDSGSGNFIVPAGKTVLTCEGWGAGGGGGGGGDGGANQAASGGAQGGYFRKTIVVSPGDLIAYAIGAAGTGGAINFDGTAGGVTTVAGGTYTANGGAKGLSASAASTAGGTASGGDINTTGANGSGRASSVAGGNGGGGALGGSGDGVAGANAVAPANGGGGGGKNGAGGNGASGRVKFSY